MYVKNGYNFLEFENSIQDCVYIENGDLIAIQIDQNVASPISDDLLGKYFWFEDGKYKAKHNIKTVKSIREIREDVYVNGFVCDGIKYVRWKRSSGASRIGKCLFINEKLYKQVHKWDMCGLNIKEGDKVDLAALESYLSLTLSSIIDTCEIYPNNILLIDDYESIFNDDMIAVTEDEDHNLVAEHKTTTVSNSIWDGESLLDESIFQQSGYEDKGCLLLRNRFFKSCCFNTCISKFFKDNGITEVSQLNGKTIAKEINEIKLITTPSSIKYMKFGSFMQWISNLDCVFGIVKHEKETHFFDGRMVSSHYQLLNTIQLSYDETIELLKPSLDFLNLLKNNPSAVRYYIKYPESIEFNLPLTALESKNDIVYKLLDINENFAETKLYANFRNDLTKSFVSSMKCGKILLNGNYQVLFGNPLEMLKSSVGQFNRDSSLGIGEIHTLRFDWNKELLCSRSPHVSSGNILISKNVSAPEIDKYFNLTEEIVCLNSIGDNILERLSGADFDNDTMLITDNSILIGAAKRNYDIFKVPTNLVPSFKTTYKYTSSDKYIMDYNTSENLIGEIINLSQELNSIIWDKLNSGSSYCDIEELYLDVSKLNVCSNIEIDKAKRVRATNSKLEISKIKQKYAMRDKLGRPIRPRFFMHIVKKKGYYIAGKKKYKSYKTTMDYVYDIITKADKKEIRPHHKPFSYILNKEPYDWNRVNYEQANRVFLLVSQYKTKVDEIWSRQGIGEKDKRNLHNEERQEIVNYINCIRFNYHTIYYILKQIDEKRKDGTTLLNILFGIPNKSFYEAIRESADKIPVLYEVIGNRFDIKIFDYKFVENYIRQ